MRLKGKRQIEGNRNKNTGLGWVRKKEWFTVNMCDVHDWNDDVVLVVASRIVLFFLLMIKGKQRFYSVEKGWM